MAYIMRIFNFDFDIFLEDLCRGIDIEQIILDLCIEFHLSRQRATVKEGLILLPRIGKVPESVSELFCWAVNDHELVDQQLDLRAFLSSIEPYSQSLGTLGVVDAATVVEAQAERLTRV